MNAGADEPRSFGFDTRAVHAGEDLVQVGGAHPMSTPIVQASSYWFASSDELDAVLGGTQPGYVYARFASPTVAAFEQAVAALEGAPGAVAFASGMAAVHAALAVCTGSPDSRVLASADCYGGTSTLLNTVMRQQGVDVEYVDVFDPRALESVLANGPASALLLEVLTNPLERVVDLDAVAALTRRYGVPLVVDATFTSPYLVRPLERGAQYVVHSATKYLGGHGDVTAGVVAAETPERVAQLRTYARGAGAVLGPTEAYLCLRGLKTLSLRVQRQCANAAAIAEALAGHPRVERVYYPGRPDSPDRAAAERLFPPGTYGAMLAFAVNGYEKPDVLRFMERLRLVRPAPTLGDVATLILYPVIASHRPLTPEQRHARGIHDNILRLSAGIEDPADIIRDLEQAFDSGA